MLDIGFERAGWNPKKLEDPSKAVSGGSPRPHKLI